MGETRANRKLSRPWFGPFRITGVGIIAKWIYGNSTKDVHLQCVTRCPPGFPAGYYWYGGCCSGPGHPPKRVTRFVEEAALINRGDQKSTL